MVQQPDKVADRLERRVRRWRVGCVAPAVAAHVGNERPVAGARHCRRLRPPARTDGGEPVAEQDRRAVAQLGDVKVDAVGWDCVTTHGGSLLAEAGTGGLSRGQYGCIAGAWANAIKGRR